MNCELTSLLNTDASGTFACFYNIQSAESPSDYLEASVRTSPIELTKEGSSQSIRGYDCRLQPL